MGDADLRGGRRGRPRDLGRPLTIDAELGGLDYAYLTTTGRVSGRPHRIEIWFSLQGPTLYLLAGGQGSADWVRNLVVTPEVTVELGDGMWPGVARVLDPGDEEDALARRLVLGKYAPRDPSDLDEWGRTSLAVAVDVAAG